MNVHVKRWDHCLDQDHVQHFVLYQPIATLNPHIEQSLNCPTWILPECLQKQYRYSKLIAYENSGCYGSMNGLINIIHKKLILYWDNFKNSNKSEIFDRFNELLYLNIKTLRRKYGQNECFLMISPSLFTTMVPTTPLCDAILFKVSSTSCDCKKKINTFFFVGNVSSDFFDRISYRDEYSIQ